MITRRRLHNIISIIFILFLYLVSFSCVSTKASLKDETIKTTPEEKASVTKKPEIVRPKSAGTILSLPAKDELVEKQLDAELMSNIETGSPLTLKSAILYIQNDSKGLTDLNKVYLKIISDMLYLLYPWETDGNVPPLYSDDDEFLRALQLVKRGIYPQSIGKDSFLALIIPALIITSPQEFEKLSADQRKDLKERLYKAQKMRKDSVLPYYLLGILSEQESDLYEAANYYKKAWNFDNSCYPAGLKYAALSAESGDGNTALKIADYLNAFYSDKYELKVLYAKTYIAKEDLDLASKYIIDILKEEPENLEALLLRVRVLIEQKEYLKANSLLDAYSTKSKISIDYLLFRSIISKEWNKNLDASKEYLSQAYKFYPNNFKILLACAEICFETSGKIDGKSANFFIQKVLAKNSQNIAALSLLTRNHINNENWKEAISLAEKIIKKKNTKVNQKLLIQAYLGGGAYNSALKMARALFYSDKNEQIDVLELYSAALFYIQNYQDLTKLINSKMQSANSEAKSVLYYYKAKMNGKNSADYLANLRSSLLANPRNKEALYSMYEWYFSKKDYRKAKYYLGQVSALSPQDKKIINLSKNLDRLLAQ